MTTKPVEANERALGSCQIEYLKIPQLRIVGSALTWHFGFRAPLNLADKSEVEKRINTIKSHIEKTFCNILQCASVDANRKPEQRMYRNFNDAFSHFGQLVEFVFVWHTIPITIRYDQYKEFAVIVVVIDLCNISSSSDDNVVKSIAHHVKELKYEIVHHEDMRCLCACHEYLYAEIWKLISRDISGVDDASAVLFGDIKTERFLNYRGIVLDTTSFLGRAPSQLDYDWLSNAFMAVKPFMESGLRAAGDAVDLTASGMLHNKALYIAHVGGEFYETSHIPGRFLICSKEPYLFEIANLVEHLYRCAYALQAASFEIDKLTIAWESLVENRCELQRAKALFQDGELNNIDEVTKIRSSIKNRIDALDGLFEVSLNFRVDMSSSYIAEFNNNIQKLGVSMLPGRQGFEEYISNITSSRKAYPSPSGRIKILYVMGFAARPIARSARKAA
jgi:hypothetical protein